MSIWDYMTDRDLEPLREWHNAITEAKSKLVQANEAKVEAENRRYQVSQENDRYDEAVLTQAIEGGDAPEPPEETSENLERLIEGMTNRISNLNVEIERLKRAFEARKITALKECIRQAGKMYKEQARDLIQSWRTLNDAQLLRGDRELQWPQIFIPALDEMSGASESFGRPTLLDGSTVDAGPLLHKLDEELLKAVS